MIAIVINVDEIKELTNKTSGKIYKKRDVEIIDDSNTTVRKKWKRNSTSGRSCHLIHGYLFFHYSQLKLLIYFEL